MPDDVETELYQHVVWMCENGYPVSWDSIKAVAWQLGKICRMQGEQRMQGKNPRRVMSDYSWPGGDTVGASCALRIVSTLYGRGVRVGAYRGLSSSRFGFVYGT